MPALQSGKRIYAIGDIHGYLDALEAMNTLIFEDLQASKIDPKNKKHDVSIVYLGDYIDRGPSSFEVIENLMAQRKINDGINRVFICGNHDLILKDFKPGYSIADSVMWFKYGGLNTLASYGFNHVHDAMRPAEIEQLQAEVRKGLPKSHRDFIKTMPFFHIEDDYLFAHAGIDPHKPVSDQTQDDYTLIREPFLSWEENLDKRVVHGHTISEQPAIFPHRIGIDVGVYKHARLGCVVLEGDAHRFIYAPTMCKGYYDPKSSE
jgi:serine/threonine protein phosphatase 1